MSGVRDGYWMNGFAILYGTESMLDTREKENGSTTYGYPTTTTFAWVANSFVQSVSTENRNLALVLLYLVSSIHYIIKYKYSKRVVGSKVRWNSPFFCKLTSICTQAFKLVNILSLPPLMLLLHAIDLEWIKARERCWFWNRISK